MSMRSGGARSGTSCGLVVASGTHVSIALLGGRTRCHWRPAPGGSSPLGPSGGQTKSGASRGGSERLVVGEHVPDCFGEFSGDVDLCDLGAALTAEAALVALVALAVGRVAQRVHGGFEHRPAQVSRALLGQRAAAIAVAGLVTRGHRPVYPHSFWARRSDRCRRSRRRSCRTAPSRS